MPFTVQQLSDLEDIKLLKHRYFRAIDTGNEALLTTLFTDDVSIDYRGAGYRAQLKGKTAMIDFIGTAFNSDIIAQHQGHMPEIEFTGPDEASGLWYLEDRFIDPARQTDTIGTAIYRDRYVRTSDGWKIARSEYDRVYETVVPINQAAIVGTPMLATTGRKPEQRVDISRYLTWYD